MNAKLANIWPELKRELQAFMIPVAKMEKLLADAGAPTTAADLGLDLEFLPSSRTPRARNAGQVLFRRPLPPMRANLSICRRANLETFIQGRV